MFVSFSSQGEKSLSAQAIFWGNMHGRSLYFQIVNATILNEGLPQEQQPNKFGCYVYGCNHLDLLRLLVQVETDHLMPSRWPLIYVLSYRKWNKLNTNEIVNVYSYL